MVNVGINGLGQIGRNVLRIAKARNLNPAYYDGDVIDPNGDHSGYSGEVQRMNVNVVAINDIGDTENLADLLRNSTTNPRLPYKVEAKGNTLVFGSQRIPVLKYTDPANIPWGDYGVDVVLEATGRFNDYSALEKHLKAGANPAGASYVVLTRPHGDKTPNATKIYTVVMGVNDEPFPLDQFNIYSNASCTTNCIAPIIKLMEDRYGIVKGNFVTVHAYTNDQATLDSPHKDSVRRGYAAAENIVPATTGATPTLKQVIPTLEASIDGIAYRVPVKDGSVAHLSLQLKNTPTTEELRAALREASEGALLGIMQYSDDELVSGHIIRNPHSAIIDGKLTRITEAGNAQIVAWYDNEFGYSNRLFDLASKRLSGVQPDAHLERMIRSNQERELAPYRA